MSDSWSQRSVGILGFGRSGRSVAEALEDRVNELIVFDDAEEPEISTSSWNGKIQWELGKDSPSTWPDEWIVSPGVPPEHEVLMEARHRGTPIRTELDVAQSMVEGTVVAITGTNGKTSTVRLLSHLLETLTERPTKACGNCGEPFTRAVLENPEAWFVVEVSSFQIEYQQSLAPDRVILTTLGSDHIDRHQTKPKYQRLKHELVDRANRRVVVPENYPNKVKRVERFGFNHQGFRRPDGSFIPLTRYVDPDELPASVSRFSGNLASSLAVISDISWEPRDLQESLKDYQPPEFRARTVELPDDRVVINDSKATNPGAVCELLDRLEEPVRLLLGGDDKDLPLDRLISTLERLEPRKILIAGRGSLANRLRRILEDSPVDYETHEGDWETAVKSLIKRSEPGETIVLSPAGTSFDAFEDYRDRGQSFDRWIREVEPRG